MGRHSSSKARSWWKGSTETVGRFKVRDNIGRRLKVELELPSMPERIPTNRRGMTACPQCLISANSISSRVYCHLIPRASHCPLCACVCVATPLSTRAPKTPRIVSRILGGQDPSNSNFNFSPEIKDSSRSILPISIFLNVSLSLSLFEREICLPSSSKFLFTSV